VKSRFHDEAESDVRAAVDYYEDASVGLGDRLLAEIRSAVRHLEEFPLSAPWVADDLHGKVLVRFPHKIYYAIDSNEVVILALAHQSQDAATWLTVVERRRHE
jgi:toxin ParE1/3/4